MVGEGILIVDDNAMNLALSEAILSGRGYPVRTAMSAEEALASLGEVVPRIILTDLQLPGLDGFELIRRLKADSRTRDIIVIALTAYAMKGDEERARAVGCDDYVTKPVGVRVLREVVERHLGAAPGGDV